MDKRISTRLTKENISAVLAILAEIPAQIESVSAHRSRDELHNPLGVGERSLLENLAHLVNCEARSAEAIYLALLLDVPLLHDVHPERHWGPLLQYERFEFAELLAYFKFRRSVLLNVLHALTDAQWARVVREENKQRQESVYWQARGLALHEWAHLTAIKEKLCKTTGQ